MVSEDGPQMPALGMQAKRLGASIEKQTPRVQDAIGKTLDARVSLLSQKLGIAERETRAEPDNLLKMAFVGFYVEGGIALFEYLVRLTVTCR